MPTLNTAELTALHTETIYQTRRARLLDNIARRAATLFQDGYTATETMTGQFVRCFQVKTPEGKTYRVKISQSPAEPGSFFGSGCNCPCFEKETTCKHLQGVELMLAQEDAQAAELDAQDAYDPYEYRF